jgi:hypothetical protein
VPVTGSINQAKKDIESKYSRGRTKCPVSHWRLRRLLHSQKESIDVEMRGGLLEVGGWTVQKFCHHEKPDFGPQSASANDAQYDSTIHVVFVQKLLAEWQTRQTPQSVSEYLSEISTADPSDDDPLPVDTLAPMEIVADDEAEEEECAQADEAAQATVELPFIAGDDENDDDDDSDDSSFGGSDVDEDSDSEDEGGAEEEGGAGNEESQMIKNLRAKAGPGKDFKGCPGAAINTFCKWLLVDNKDLTRGQVIKELLKELAQADEVAKVAAVRIAGTSKAKRKGGADASGGGASSTKSKKSGTNE